MRCKSSKHDILLPRLDSWVLEINNRRIITGHGQDGAWGFVDNLQLAGKPRLAGRCRTAPDAGLRCEHRLDGSGEPCPRSTPVGSYSAARCPFLFSRIVRE